MADAGGGSDEDPRLRQRLLRDIKELQVNPYPGIQLVVNDHLTSACLILSRENEPPLHLTVHFMNTYPISPPRITIQSIISHPNVFGDYICIDLLKERYTPAYTLKGICIQVLSFFVSETVEQDYGGKINRKQYEEEMAAYNRRLVVGKDTCSCKTCGFGIPISVQQPDDAQDVEDTELPDAHVATVSQIVRADGEKPKKLNDLPSELLLHVCEHLDDSSLLLAVRAYPNLFGNLVYQHNVIYTRELCCFTLKRGFKDLDIGIGVHMAGRNIESEFDFISRDAYNDHKVRRSISGRPFELWLPLPMSYVHWKRVKISADDTLNTIARSVNIQGPLDKVLYTFMNEIVVRLSAASETERNSRYMDRGMGLFGHNVKSALIHASDKAIESYFHLFHLLLCLVVDRPEIARDANRLISEFISGSRGKDRVPNIGHLLIAVLISDIESSEDLTKGIIKESITRNVVWMLEAQPRGKGYTELSFMETSAISIYRLEKTFEASKTSYRLLMFLNLMGQVVRTARDVKDKNGVIKKMTLEELRDDLFKRHGAPPQGAAAEMAAKIRDIQKVDSFPDFLRNMGVSPPQASAFTSFLRTTVEDSMKRGYSKWGLPPAAALLLRIQKEGPGVERPEGLQPKPLGPNADRVTFFPENGGGGRGGRGDAGGGNGRGRGNRY